MAAYTKTKHDMGILRADGTTKVGLMLRKNRREVPVWGIYDDEYLAQQFSSGAQGYANLPAEKELAIIQDDWRAGLALDIFDSNDPKRYHKSTMDLRYKNSAICGQTPTTVTLPSHSGSISNYTHLTNPGFEDNNIDGWSAGAVSTAVPQAGTYHWRVTGITSGTATYTIPWDTSFRGKAFTFSAYFRVAFTDDGGSPNGLARGRVNVADGVDTTNSSYVTQSGGGGTTGYTQVSAAHTVNGSGTKLELQIQYETSDTSDTTGHYVYCDTLALTHPDITGPIIAFKEFNDKLYLARGADLEVLNAGGTAFTSVKSDFDQIITDLEVFSDDKLYLAMGLSDPYWEMTTAEAFTENTLSNNNMKYLAFVRTTADTMYASDGANTVRSTTNPANGGTPWSAQTTVDSSYHAITKVMEKSGALYIMKEDIPYYLDSSGNVQTDLAPSAGHLNKTTDNGKNTILWLNKLYMPWGTSSLIEEDGGTVTYRNPGFSTVDAEEYIGQVFAVSGDEQWLYAVTDNNASVEIMAGRLETIDSTTGWVWHCIGEITLTGCETAFVSSVVASRLWISSTASSESLYYYPLFVDYPNTPTALYKTGTTFETSWLHGNFKANNKAFTELTLVMNHTYDADIYFTVKYKKLGDSSWTTIGNYTGSATSMTESKYIPVDGSGNNPSSTHFKLQFTAVTDDTDKTPELKNYHLKAILYPGERELIATTVYCANEMELKDGTIDSGSYDTIIATINEARSATWPVTIYDIDGNTKTVKFLPFAQSTPKRRVVGNERNRELEVEFNLLMQVVTLS